MFRGTWDRILGCPSFPNRKLVINFHFLKKYQISIDQYRIFCFQAGTVSLTDFIQVLQEVTNFPLRPFVLPFLRNNIPLLARDVASLAVLTCQTPLQYLKSHQHLLLDLPTGTQIIYPRQEKQGPKCGLITGSNTEPNDIFHADFTSSGASTSRSLSSHTAAAPALTAAAINPATAAVAAAAARNLAMAAAQQQQHQQQQSGSKRRASPGPGSPPSSSRPSPSTRRETPDFEGYEGSNGVKRMRQDEKGASIVIRQQQRVYPHSWRQPREQPSDERFNGAASGGSNAAVAGAGAGGQQHSQEDEWKNIHVVRRLNPT